MGRGRYGKGMLNFCVRVLYNAYIVAKYELWSSMLWEKLAMIKDCVFLQIVNFFWGATHRHGRYRKRMVNFCGRPSQCLYVVANMNCGQVCYGKSWQGSKTVYCANSQFGGATHRQGWYRKGMLNFFGRPLQCLSCGKI